jgi:penicillin-binding protein 2
MFLQPSILLLMALLMPWTTVPIRPAGFPLRFPKIEARYDAVVLVADAQSGELLGGVNTARAGVREYYPASIFKLAIAVAALNSGRVSSTFAYTCHGKDTIDGTVQECWDRRGHGKLDFRRALAHSCNLYFRQISQKLSRSEIMQAARMLDMMPEDGFSGVESGSSHIELSDDNLLGESFTVSPMQLLHSALTIASRGRLSRSGVRLFDRLYRPLYDGLKGCIREGTGRNAMSRTIAMAGKTGTAELPGTVSRTVGWFIGFAPADAPKYAVCVMVRRARGSDAAVIARDVLKEIL